MPRSNVRSQGPVRDEVAVSAAVATVLLFGGVLSLIAILMVNVIPVIAELEGAVQRHDMGAQMSDLAPMWPNLRKPDTPAMSAWIQPVDGTIAWDRQDWDVVQCHLDGGRRPQSDLCA